MKLFAIRLLLLWTLPLCLAALILGGKEEFRLWIADWRELWRDLPEELADLEEDDIEFQDHETSHP